MSDKEKAIEIVSSVIATDSFKDLSVQANKKVVFNLLLDDPQNQEKKSQIISEIESKLKQAGFLELDVYTTQKASGHRPLGGLRGAGELAPKTPVPGIKNIIAINSGQGGVGKSTCSVNLAIALKQLGFKVGLLDADVTGPNVHLMLGQSQKPHVTEDRKVMSLEAYGIRLISMGTLVDENKPTIWRGPMLDGVIKQFLRDVEWGELDYLLIDLPPGTSDAQLTLCQNVPLTGTVIVTTPQDVALLDAKKGLAMFRNMGVPILGIIENMSFFSCPHCSQRTEIFSHGGAQKSAQELGINFLGEIPIDLEVRTGGDNGKPITVVNPEHAVSKAFVNIANTMIEYAKEQEAQNV